MRFAIVILCFMGSLVLAVSDVSAQNAWPNPGFEVEGDDGPDGTPAEWSGTNNPFALRSNEVAHNGDWSMEIDNSQGNSFGQWKEIRPAPIEYPVEPGDEIVQSVWVYYDDAEDDLPLDTRVTLITRWNGDNSTANNFNVTLGDIEPNEWFLLEQELIAPDEGGDGADLTFATPFIFVDTLSADNLGGRFFLDDACWGFSCDVPDLPGVLGDFNGDDLVDAADINALSAAVAAGTNDGAFDLNSDSLVDAQDRSVWVEDVKKTWFGDANLDGEFNSADFVFVFTAGEYEDGVAGNSVWEEGDWNGDSEFDSSDFVEAFSAGGYENGPRAATQAVPEPTGSVAIWLLCTLGWAGCRRYRG